MKVKVSIIVPVYNVENYLDKCLNSLVNQTLKEIEIIVVNDGTKDNSQSIIDRYVKDYPNKVSSYKKKNGGLSSARNYGIKKASGEFLAFVDGDDYVEFDMYELMYNKAIETGSDIVCCSMTYKYNLTAEKRFFMHPEYFGNNITKKLEILIEARSYAANKIYKKDLWKNFEFPNQYFEDSAVIYNVMYEAKKIECVNYPLYNYIKERPNQITNSVNTNTMYDIFKSCDCILNFYKNKKNYSKYQDVVEFLCLNHLIIRLGYLYTANMKKFCFKFYKDTKKYLKKNIPNWRKNKYLKLQKNDKRHNNKVLVLKCPTLFKIAVIVSPKTIVICKKIVKLPFRIMKKVYNKYIKNVKKEKNKYILKNGYEVLADISKIMNKNKVLAFADFGTMLGIVREKKILSHDLDMDIGIIGDKNTIEKVNFILERNGFKLWREYIANNKIVERSYHYKSIKVDFNFYESYDDCVKTYLFYRDPNKHYKKNERDIVEMKYSKIKEFKQIDIKGNMINVPSNAEQILEEKYGPTWRIPDKGWIYWKSPAAKKIDGVGYFIKYKYEKGNE